MLPRRGRERTENRAHVGWLKATVNLDVGEVQHAVPLGGSRMQRRKGRAKV